jgi:UDP-N-acetylmuramoyl-L-alanyl-D-glutamate--2,6-diaminopimelate ligase
VTDDNPRTESAEKIFNDISSVDEALDFYYIHDRSSAITQAIEKTAPSGVVLIAGKGHENYQEIMGIRNEYSDAAVLLSLGYRSAGGDHVA